MTTTADYDLAEIQDPRSHAQQYEGQAREHNCGIPALPQNGFIKIPRDTFIHRIDFSEDLFLATKPIHDSPSNRIFHISNVAGHKPLSESVNNETASVAATQTPHVQFRSGPSESDPVLGKGWFHGNKKAWLSVALPPGSSSSDFAELNTAEPFKYDGMTYRLRLGTTERTKALADTYIAAGAQMGPVSEQRHRWHSSGMEFERLCDCGDWRTVGYYAGAKNSMRLNPRRIVGVVRWEEEGVGRVLGMLAVLVVSEQERKMTLADYNDAPIGEEGPSGCCVVS